MKIIVFFFFILLGFSSLKAQDTCRCDIVFERKELPKNFYLAQLKDSAKLSNELKLVLSEKYSYSFQFALFYFTVNRKGIISNLKLSHDPSLSQKDRIFLESIASKLKNSQWCPAHYKGNYRRKVVISKLTFSFSVEPERNLIEVLVNDEDHDRVLFNKIYSIN
jgi:hypothetical protein